MREFPGRIRLAVAQSVAVNWTRAKSLFNRLPRELFATELALRQGNTR